MSPQNNNYIYYFKPCQIIKQTKIRVLYTQYNKGQICRHFLNFFFLMKYLHFFFLIQIYEYPLKEIFMQMYGQILPFSTQESCFQYILFILAVLFCLVCSSFHYLIYLDKKAKTFSAYFILTLWCECLLLHLKIAANFF